MKRQLFAVLTAVSMLGFTSPALAAPSVVFKKQLAVPKIDARILPLGARNLNQELAQEFECGDTIYRYWIIPIKQEFPNRAGYDVFEARRGNTTKYKVSNYSYGLYYGRNYGYIACASDGIYVIDSRYHPRGTYGQTWTIRVPFADFQNDRVWNFETGVQRGYVDSSNGTYWYNPAYRPVLIDGILQLPGTLTLSGTLSNGTNGVSGDSRPATIESNGDIIRHTLPWYRNLNETPKKPVGITLKAEFYRLSDGYGVKETMLNCDGESASKDSCIEENVTFYRIRNGESAYTVVTSLPFQSLSRNSYVSQGSYGATLSRMSDYKEYALIHRLPEIKDASGYSIYSVRGSVIAENDTTAYARYLITDSRNGARQYWEVTVQK
jgi:hypothetical protein